MLVSVAAYTWVGCGLVVEIGSGGWGMVCGAVDGAGAVKCRAGVGDGASAVIVGSDRVG